MLTFHHSLHLSEAGNYLRRGPRDAFCWSLTWGHCFLALAMVTCQLVCGESKHDRVLCSVEPFSGTAGKVRGTRITTVPLKTKGL